jgi:tetratricopeptide (TPR) repeat protein
VTMLLVIGVLAGPAMAQRQLDRALAQEDTSLEQAGTTAASARSWDRWDPAVIEFQGLVAEREGRFEDAARLYRRAATLALQPWNDSYREARALERAGLTEQSLEACRRAIASNPLEPELRRGVCEDAE